MWFESSSRCERTIPIEHARQCSVRTPQQVARPRHRGRGRPVLVAGIGVRHVQPTSTAACQGWRSVAASRSRHATCSSGATRIRVGPGQSRWSISCGGGECLSDEGSRALGFQREPTPCHYQRIAHRGACGKTRVVPQNRWPKPESTGTGVAKCVWCCRRTGRAGTSNRWWRHTRRRSAAAARRPTHRQATAPASKIILCGWPVRVALLPVGRSTRRCLKLRATVESGLQLSEGSRVQLRS
jgi:hypothetical protein